MPAEESVVAQTRPPGVSKGPLDGTESAGGRVHHAGTAAALRGSCCSERPHLVDFISRAGSPSQRYKVRAQGIKRAPVRGTRHTRHVPTSIALVEPESRM